MVGNEVVIRKACEADFEFILEANAAVSEKGSNTVLKDTERLKKDLFGKTARAAAKRRWSTFFRVFTTLLPAR